MDLCLVLYLYLRLLFLLLHVKNCVVLGDSCPFIARVDWRIFPYWPSWGPSPTSTTCILRLGRVVVGEWMKSILNLGLVGRSHSDLGLSAGVPVQLGSVSLVCDMPRGFNQVSVRVFSYLLWSDAPGPEISVPIWVHEWKLHLRLAIVRPSSRNYLWDCEGEDVFRF